MHWVKEVSVGNDGMVKMVSLYFLIILVSFC